MARGQYREALDKLRAAQRRAPGWGRNQLLIGNALEKLGRKHEALEAWRAAAGLDLSATDRKAVELLVPG